MVKFDVTSSYYIANNDDWRSQSMGVCICFYSLILPGSKSEE